MRRSDTQKLNEVIKQLLKELKIEDKLKDAGIIRSWSEVVGTYINKYTKDIFIKDSKLFVKIESSVVKQELLTIKDGLIKTLNEKAGEEVIKDIIFI
jgi:predicted nucleic acid-binding Zn ribbon protein